MIDTGWTLATVVALAAATSAGAQTRHAQTPPWQATLGLNLRNEAGVSAMVLADAKETLTRIYRAAGIRVEWNTAGAALTIVVRAPPHPAAVRDSPFALGYAPRTKSEHGQLAFVIADRIENTAKWLALPQQLVLGMAMAHEVAHLLLPYNSHSSHGIMRNDWSQSDYEKARRGQLLFTVEQAQLMRDRLSVTNGNNSP